VPVVLSVVDPPPLVPEAENFRPYRFPPLASVQTTTKLPDPSIATRGEPALVVSLTVITPLSGAPLLYTCAYTVLRGVPATRCVPCQTTTKLLVAVLAATSVLETSSPAMLLNCVAGVTGVLLSAPETVETKPACVVMLLFVTGAVNVA